MREALAALAVGVGRDRHGAVEAAAADRTGERDAVAAGNADLAGPGGVRAGDREQAERVDDDDFTGTGGVRGHGGTVGFGEVDAAGVARGGDGRGLGEDRVAVAPMAGAVSVMRWHPGGRRPSN